MEINLTPTDEIQSVPTEEVAMFDFGAEIQNYADLLTRAEAHYRLRNTDQGDVFLHDAKKLHRKIVQEALGLTQIQCLYVLDQLVSAAVRML